MLFEEEDITACLDKACDIRELYELYVLHGKTYPKSVDDLLWICQEYLKKQILIEYVDLPAEGSSIHASYWAMAEGSYRIGVLLGLSEDQLRFVLCKELFHVIFDEARRRSLALSEHVEEYTSTFQLDDGQPNCAAAWETLAEIAALEFLFPYEYRRAAAQGDGAVNYARLATMYGLPRYFVEVGCGEGNLDYIGKRIRAAAHC